MKKPQFVNNVLESIERFCAKFFDLFFRIFRVHFDIFSSN